MLLIGKSYFWPSKTLHYYNNDRLLWLRGQNKHNFHLTESHLWWQFRYGCFIQYEVSGKFGKVALYYLRLFMRLTQNMDRRLWCCDMDVVRTHIQHCSCLVGFPQLSNRSYETSKATPRRDSWPRWTLYVSHRISAFRRLQGCLCFTTLSVSVI